ncbi:MAG: MBL fold metallo-hydrolase [Candidatus Nanohaloarchaea archaeon]
MKLKFLGTGGGRYVTGVQRRKTGGIILCTDETQVHIDPGPGALIQAQEHRPEDTEAVIVSHGHLDHCNDANALIEMMTQSHDKPGAIFANKSTLEGYADIDKMITSYHQELCGRVDKLEEASSHAFGDLEIQSQQMFHGDPKTQGLKISDGSKSVGFWTDSEYSGELTNFYSGCDTLVIYCARPRNSSIEGHTSLDDVPSIVEGLDVSTVIITHFGYKFLDQNLEKQKEWLDQEIEPKVIFAEDGMEYPGNRSLGDF